LISLVLTQQIMLYQLIREEY